MPRRTLLYGFLVIAAILAGCAGPSETAVVTERPTEPAETTEVIGETQAPAAPADQETTALMADTVQVGRFARGKLWTFEHPPLDYFEEAYGFRPDDRWLTHARLAALRFAEYCSASFVSPHGLVMTNHHCARESITEVSRPDEELLERGFYAETLDAERKVPDLYVEQLVRMEEVTDEINEAVADVESNALEVLSQARSRQVDLLEEQRTRQAQARDSSLRVQVVELYDGARYSAYTYRRYDDVRLAMAPELDVGFFGGRWDNFTYPRFTLDVSFFRVYDADGDPLSSPTYFRWSDEGVAEGDVVFAVGNPGSTSRLSTVAQLTFERDYVLPQQLEVLRARATLLDDYIEEHPEEAEAYDLRNLYFTVTNSVKATEGQLEGLRDPYLIARRTAAEQALLDSIAVVDSLQERYGQVIDAIEQVQRAQRVTARQNRAFTFFTNSRLGSRILTRGVYGYLYDQLQQRAGITEEQLATIREQALDIEDWPDEVEEAVLTRRLRTVQETLGPADPTVQRALQGRAPEAVAERLVAQSALVDSAGFARLLREGYLSSDDPSVDVVRPIASLFLEVTRQRSEYEASIESLPPRLARARFAVYGTDVPPDATFTLRLSDGIVRGYDYNGTFAPPYTNYFGLYDHAYSYAGQYDDEPWDLPEEWFDEREELDLSTPLNLVSTNDIAGGSSGSPLLNRELEIVGLVFDSNLEALPNIYLYTTDDARAISVDARGILEALQEIYEAERLVEELTTGEMTATDAMQE